MYVFKFEHIQTWWIIGQGSLSFNCQATQHSKDHTQQNSATGGFRAHGTKSSARNATLCCLCHLCTLCIIMGFCLFAIEATLFCLQFLSWAYNCPSRKTIKMLAVSVLQLTSCMRQTSGQNYYRISSNQSNTVYHHRAEIAAVANQIMTATERGVVTTTRCKTLAARLGKTMIKCVGGHIFPNQYLLPLFHHRVVVSCGFNPI